MGYDTMTMPLPTPWRSRPWNARSRDRIFSSVVCVCVSVFCVGVMLVCDIGGNQVRLARNGAPTSTFACMYIYIYHTYMLGIYTYVYTVNT